jgi:hypothetical protein
MDVFLIDVPNRPGELAKASEALAAKGVNIATVGALGSGDQGFVGLLTSEDVAARAALDEAGVTYRTCPCVTVTVPNRPGELAKVTRRLSDAGINLEFVAPTALTDPATIAMGVSDADAARAALSADS